MSVERKQRTKGAGHCGDCRYLVNMRYEIVVPDGPEDGMSLWVCHRCNMDIDLTEENNDD